MGSALFVGTGIAIYGAVTKYSSSWNVGIFAVLDSMTCFVSKQL